MSKTTRVNVQNNTRDLQKRPTKEMSEERKRPMLVATCDAVCEYQKQHVKMSKTTQETYKRDQQKKSMSRIRDLCSQQVYAAVCECQKYNTYIYIYMKTVHMNAKKYMYI